MDGILQKYTREGEDMAEGKPVSFVMKADESLRKGAYANLVEVKSMSKESIMSFFFADEAEESEEEVKMSGTMVARVVMTHDTLLELRDLLNKHIEDNFGATGDRDGE